jgi:hypothetical protein
LDGAAQFSAERDSATLQADLARDSSLYYIGGLINHIGVARDTASTTGDWTHSITERGQIALDASWQRVRYHEPANFNELIDYRYLSAGPTFAYAVSERDTLKVLGSYGHYASLDGSTQSKTENAQVGFVRQLSEIWSLSTSAGYSRSRNSEKTFERVPFDLFFYFLIPITQKSTQNGTVYAASLTRQGERLTLSGGVSRALQPTGFAFLSRQDSYNANATYVGSERWDVSLSAAWLKAVNPQVSAGLAQFNTPELNERFLNAHLAATWHFTPQWSLSAGVTRISQQYVSAGVISISQGYVRTTASAASTGINVDFGWHFLRTQF